MLAHRLFRPTLYVFLFRGNVLERVGSDPHFSRIDSDPNLRKALLAPDFHVSNYSYDPAFGKSAGAAPFSFLLSPFSANIHVPIYDHTFFFLFMRFFCTSQLCSSVQIAYI